MAILNNFRDNLYVTAAISTIQNIIFTYKIL